MLVGIANPIYDAVFKYMMKDNAVAKLLISSIIGENIIKLESKPQEYPADKERSELSSLTVYRLDFSAHIETPEGHKVVIIEMQKASLPTDIMRFRHYLGEQYTDPENSVQGKKTSEAMQIYSIYFLGKELGVCDTPVLSVLPDVRDVSTGKAVKKRSTFIEGLNHKCWIVQIPCLKERRRNELEQILSVFDQSNRSSDRYILNVREEDFPEKHRAIIRRLKSAAASQTVKKQMKDEDGIVWYLKDWLRTEAYELEQENKEIIRQQEEAMKLQADELKQQEEAMKQQADELKQQADELKLKDEAMKKQTDELKQQATLIAELQAKLKKSDQADLH